MKYIQVKHVFISSPSGDWNFFDFIIHKNVATYIQSTSEKSDHEVRMHIPPSDTLRKVSLHESMRKILVQHLICFTIALMHFKIYLH